MSAWQLLLLAVSTAIVAWVLRCWYLRVVAPEVHAATDARLKRDSDVAAADAEEKLRQLAEHVQALREPPNRPSEAALRALSRRLQQRGQSDGEGVA